MQTPYDLYRAVRTKYFNKTKDRAEREKKFEGRGDAKSLYPHMGDLEKGGDRPPDVTMIHVDGEIFVVGHEDEDSRGNTMLTEKEGVSVTETFGAMGGWDGAIFCCLRRQ